MSEILTNNKYYKDIADTIRQMKGVATTYKPREMAGALREMYSTEVEGVPPLTFPSNGNNLLNYRIDGANGGVGDRTKNLANSNEMIQGYWAYADGTYIRANTWICTPKIACKGNVGYTFQFANNSRWYGFVWYGENGNYISTSNIQNTSSTPYRTYTATSPSNARYLVINIAGYPGTNDTIRTDDLINFQLEERSTATDYEPYGYKIPVVISGKNLWNEDYTDIPVNIPIYKPLYLGEGTFTLSTSAPLNSNNAANLFLMSGNVTQGASTNTTGCWNGHPITAIANNGYVTIAFRSQYNVNPADYQSQIELGSQATNYEQYIEPTTTNIYLDEPIGANESKSLSDTNVNIPTINGTNILSIDTTVQPSNVYVQAPKTNNYNL